MPETFVAYAWASVQGPPENETRIASAPASGERKLIAISLVELQLHVAAALAPHGIRVEEIEVMPAADGAWRIRLNGTAAGLRASTDAASQVEATLGRRYKVHRFSAAAANGG
jgi:hypothetical protein